MVNKNYNVFGINCLNTVIEKYRRIAHIMINLNGLILLTCFKWYILFIVAISMFVDGKNKSKFSKFIHSDLIQVLAL